MAKTLSTPNLDQFTLLPSDVLEGEQLRLEYIPISEVIRWPDNPKLHDIGEIINSIETNGFRDPPTYDAQLGALVEGNGRCEALSIMMRDNKPLPRGVVKNKDTQEWCMPILFGIDSVSQAAAIRYAIDHNNLVMSGGDFTALDMSRLWNREQYLEILQGVSDTGTMPVTIDFDDLEFLTNSPLFSTGDGSVSGNTDSSGELALGLGGEDGSGSMDNDSVVVFTVTCHNVNIAPDVEDAIQALLDDNPGWDTEMKRRGSKPNEY